MRCLFEGGIYLNVVHNKECYYGIIIFRIKLNRINVFVFDYIGATALVHFFVPKTALDRGSAYSSKYCIQIIKVNLHCILYVKSFVQKCMIKNATQIDCAIFCFFFAACKNRCLRQNSQGA